MRTGKPERSVQRAAERGAKIAAADRAALLAARRALYEATREIDALFRAEAPRLRSRIDALIRAAALLHPRPEP